MKRREGGLELSVGTQWCPSLAQGEGRARSAVRDGRTRGWVIPAGALPAGEAGGGLILPIASKEPLSDKKLKQKDYLGRMICVLQLLPKTTSPRPVGAGNQGIPWTKMVQTAPRQPSEGVSVAKLPLEDAAGTIAAAPTTAGPRGGRYHTGAVCWGSDVLTQKANSEPAKGIGRNAAG